MSDLKLVLVIDDDTGLCKLIAQALKAEFRVSLTYNGSDGLEAYQALHPDLILLDIAMPTMTGWEVASAIREAEKGGRHTPILIMSAQSRVLEVAQESKIVIDGYISKPASMEEIQTQVRGVFEKN
jgi:DNA-binding response OmpR family regulator